MRVFDINYDFIDVENDFKLNESQYWIVANVENTTDIKNLVNKFSLDEESMLECLSEGINPCKIIFYDGYMFLTLSVLELIDEKIHCKELNIYLSKDYIITIYKSQIEIIEELLRDIKTLKNCFILKENPKPAHILYYLIDRIIINNYETIANLETLADKIEISILKKPMREHADNLINLRRQVYKIRKNLSPLRYVGDSLLSNDNNIIDKENLKYFKSINDKISKLMIELENLISNLALVREAFESEISNKTNDLMKIFTIITSIFLPLNLFTSMQGMNFENMPLANNEWGYYYTLGIMLVVSLILLLIFKKKKWL
ncbi:magnesium transporter CorA family protein [Clostridium grantii]|uniref:Magnesium transporter n=1 Tax=Clostridium grantii DSM 8605 TaxID=1121316 RepID=A0A1M5RG22_9CLOT|nr:magnesium transporter CorA family protein [Clostridium grantii]SHH24969.1 magnesium transporter [Clostridium grantii DSM 8605]